MTFRESMIKTLIEMGMFESQANNLIDEYSSNESSEMMKNRWNDNMRDYPVELQESVWIDVKYFAEVWIRENIPGAWYLPMFKSDY